VAAFGAAPLSGWVTLHYAEAVRRRSASVTVARRIRRFGQVLPPLIVQREALRAEALSLLATTDPSA
jgi:hypothetical protein